MNYLEKPYAQLIIQHLDEEPSKDVKEIAHFIASRPGVEAILFYGNQLRDANAKGLFDIYVLTKNNHTYHGFGLAAVFNKLLPPNVYFEKRQGDDGPIGAKVAVMSLKSFRSRMKNKTFDTTLWARFSQPSQLLYASNDTARNDVISAIIDAYETASWWAGRLSPQGSSSSKVWENLFAHTYGAELRVETSGRAKTIVSKAPALYSALHEAHIAQCLISEQERHEANAMWKRRRQGGKCLNVTRLLKAAFTFRGGIAYAISKVERHSGQSVELSPWQARLPWLALPFVVIRLLREGRLR